MYNFVEKLEHLTVEFFNVFFKPSTDAAIRRDLYVLILWHFVTEALKSSYKFLEKKCRNCLPAGKVRFMSMRLDREGHTCRIKRSAPQARAVYWGLDWIVMSTT